MTAVVLLADLELVAPAPQDNRTGDGVDHSEANVKLPARGPAEIPGEQSPAVALRVSVNIPRLAQPS